MNFKEICDLITLVAEKGIPEVEVEHAGVKVKIHGMVENPAPGAATVGNALQPAAVNAAPAIEEDLIIVTAPMVGTFYRAPKPDADPFVKVGNAVEEGSILCIIEAMKLMNEIEAEISGTVVKIFVENGESVEFGQNLFAIKEA